MTTIRFDRDDWLDTVKLICQAAKGKNPALCVNVYRRQVTLACTDDDLVLSTRLPATVDGPKVNAQVPLHLVTKDKIPPGPVTLEIGDEQATVTTGSLTANVDLLPGAGPPIYDPEGQPVRLDEDDVDAIRTVADFASRDWARPILTAVELGRGWAAATNSYQLAAHPIGLDREPVLFPARLVGLLPSEGDWKFHIKGSRLSWQVGPVQVDARLVGDEFPNWQALVDEGPLATRWTVNRQACIDALTTLEQWSKDLNEPKPVVFHPDGTLSVSDRCTVKLGWNTEGAEQSVALNPGFARDLLEACGEDTVTLSFDDPLKPVRIVEDELLLMLMPVRVTDTVGKAA